MTLSGSRQVASAALPRPVALNQAVRPQESQAEKISIRNLNFFYGEAKALKDISLPLYEKCVTAFIGPSGCGKSTLLRVLNRIYELYPKQRAEGEVLLDGRDILKEEHQPAARQGRYGLPEADTVPDVDLRQHRLRYSPLR